MNLKDHHPWNVNAEFQGLGCFPTVYSRPAETESDWIWGWDLFPTNQRICGDPSCEDNSWKEASDSTNYVPRQIYWSQKSSSINKPLLILYEHHTSSENQKLSWLSCVFGHGERRKKKKAALVLLAAQTWHQLTFFCCWWWWWCLCGHVVLHI